MMRHQLGVRWRYLVILGLAAGLASCSKSTDSGSAAQSAAAQSSAAQSATTTAAAPAASGAAAPAPPAAGPIAASTAIASAQYSLDPNLRADLLEVKRVSGGALLVRWRLVDTAGAQSSTGLVAGSAPKAIPYNSWDWSELYYTDPAENKKYGFLTDTDGGRLLDVYIGTYTAGDQHDNWAKFPAPPATSSKVTIYIPKFPPFEDVPVS
jgi:hypothetical protein